MDHDAFQQKLEDFLVRHNMGPTSFGKLAVNDSAFVFRVRKGRSPRLKQADKVMRFMERMDMLMFTG
jgi:predicted transcriptional regulator